MNRPLALPLATAALALAVAATPAGAASWSPPSTLSTTPHTFAGPLQAAVGETGAAIVAWPWQDGTNANATAGMATAGRGPRGGAFAPDRAAPAFLAGLGTFGDDRAVGLTDAALGPGDRRRLGLAFGSTTGGLGTPHAFRTAPIVFRPRLAVGVHGAAVAAWVEVRRIAGGRQTWALRVFERRSSSLSIPPRTMLPAGATAAFAVAVGARGDAVLAAAHGSRLDAWVKPAGGEWGRPQLLTRAARRVPTRWQIVAAVTDRGGMRVVWRRHELSHAGIPSRSALEDAGLAPGSTRFAGTNAIERDGASQPVLVPRRRGYALADVEQTTEGPRPAVRLASGHGEFKDARYAAPAGGGIRGVQPAAAADGTIVVAWVQPLPGGDGDGQIRAAALAAGASVFGPVEEVSPAEAAHEVVLLPEGGGVGAVWTARPEGTGPGIPLARIHTLVRTATRTP
jgi:hypothetical protein